MITLFLATDFEANYFTTGLKQVSETEYLGDYRLIITGPGLVNMSAAVSQAAECYPHGYFINIGIAGAVKDILPGTVKEVNTFNMFSASKFPQSSEGIWKMSYPEIKNGNGCKLHTSLHPVWNEDEKNELSQKCDLVDMEGYAFAKTCDDKGVEYSCFKAVSDNLVKKSHEDFMENAKAALVKLQEFMKPKLTS